MIQIFCLGYYPIWFIARYKIDNFAIGVGIDWSEGIDIYIRLGPIFIDLIIGERPDC